LQSCGADAGAAHDAPPLDVARIIATRRTLPGHLS
jgi:hypothetical protein